MSATYSLLLNFKQDPRNLVRVVFNVNNGIASTTTNKNEKRKKKIGRAHV